MSKKPNTIPNQPIELLVDRSILREECERLRGALEFYADDGNWAFTPSKETNMWAATTILDDSSACDNLTGGRRARKALAGRGAEET